MPLSLPSCPEAYFSRPSEFYFFFTGTENWNSICRKLLLGQSEGSKCCDLNIFGAKNQKFVILLRAILEEGESHISKVAKLNKEISVRCICVKLNIQNCECFKLFSSILWPTLVPNCLKLDITVLWIACFNWLRFERCCSICLNFMLEKIVNKIWSSHDLSYIIWNSIKMQVLIDIELRKIRITSIKTTDIGLQRIERDIKR